MDFVTFENAGKKMLEQFPIVKKICKRVYQLIMYTISTEKIKVEGKLERVTPKDEFEYFYGYYDKSPWDSNNRYIICLKVKKTYVSVAPKTPVDIILIDTKNNNSPKKLTSSIAWNVQQGCMVQWLGPEFNEKIIFNDYRDGKYCSIIYNIIEEVEEKILPMPIYDVAKDGKYAVSLDFSRLHRMRPGYGYSNIPDSTKGELCPNKTCIWKIDLITGEVISLLNYTDLLNFKNKSDMNQAEHKVNHLMISPDGNRLMVIHRWFVKDRKNSRLITMNSDGKELYNLSDEVFVSHCYWKNNNQILAFLRKKEFGDKYYLLNDKKQHYKMFWPEINTDGHCSYSPDNKYVITDTYPNRKRLASIYICQEKSDKVTRIARVFSPFRYDNEVRCDLHPRWNRLGTEICFDSVHEGKREIYKIKISREVENEEN